MVCCTARVLCLGVFVAVLLFFLLLFLLFVCFVLEQQAEEDSIDCLVKLLETCGGLLHGSCALFGCFCCCSSFFFVIVFVVCLFCVGAASRRRLN